MHIQLTGNRDELDMFLRDFRSAFHGRYLIGHYIDSTYACTTAVCAGRNSDDGHVHHGFAVIGPPPPEIDPHERLDTPPAACQERMWLVGPTPCGCELVDGVCGLHGRVTGGTVAEIAQRLADSGAVVAVMAPDGRVYLPGDVTLVGPANGPQRPSEVTSTGPDGVTQKLAPDADGWYEVPCDEGAPTHPGPCCDNPGPQP
jgi:hypothetical protein